ncbi:MAG TPA: hypothetical protein VFR21_09230 [Bradyrhizobium sp.]|nr:hypothetical protein [Bradyrhizobium sp.]
MKHLLSASLALAVIAVAGPEAHAESFLHVNDSAVLASQSTEPSLELGGARITNTLAPMPDPGNTSGAAGSSTSESERANDCCNPVDTLNLSMAPGGNAASAETLPADRPGDRGPKPDKWD